VVEMRLGAWEAQRELGDREVASRRRRSIASPGRSPRAGPGPVRHRVRRRIRLVAPDRRTSRSRTVVRAAS